MYYGTLKEIKILRSDSFLPASIVVVACCLQSTNNNEHQNERHRTNIMENTIEPTPTLYRIEQQQQLGI
ncbi:hypothetical protein BLOT_008600 [Blomia tropicalis]|nr:hypothetical protein BLOT_008600 [Blomia tropicalis]